MPSFEFKLSNIVVLGRHNAQILTHDFLVNNEILPVSEEPFLTLFKETEAKGKPFTQFISTPPLVLIKYGHIHITVEETRFQIVDVSGNDPQASPIGRIASKYFSVLRHTPVAVGGFNFNGIVRFQNAKEEAYFEDGFLAHRAELCKSLETSDLQVTLKLEYPWHGDNLCRLEVAKVGNAEHEKQLNLNYEFKLSSPDSLSKQVQEIPKVYAYFNRIREALLGTK